MGAFDPGAFDPGAFDTDSIVVGVVTVASTVIVSLLPVAATVSTAPASLPEVLTECTVTVVSVVTCAMIMTPIADVSLSIVGGL